MRTPEELADIAEDAAERASIVGDNRLANAVAASAITSLNGHSMATGMLAVAYIIHQLAEDTNDRAAFMATIVRLVAGAEPMGEIH